MKIILTGFMGSGKSTIAERLSNMLDIKNIEMDDLVLYIGQAAIEKENYSILLPNAENW